MLLLFLPVDHGRSDNFCSGIVIMSSVVYRVGRAGGCVGGWKLSTGDIDADCFMMSGVAFRTIPPIGVIVSRSNAAFWQSFL